MRTYLGPKFLLLSRVAVHQDAGRKGPQSPCAEWNLDLGKPNCEGCFWGRGPAFSRVRMMFTALGAGTKLLPGCVSCHKTSSCTRPFLFLGKSQRVSLGSSFPSGLCAPDGFCHFSCLAGTHPVSLSVLTWAPSCPFHWNYDTELQLQASLEVLQVAVCVPGGGVSSGHKGGWSGLLAAAVGSEHSLLWPALSWSPKARGFGLHCPLTNLLQSLAAPQPRWEVCCGTAGIAAIPEAFPAPMLSLAGGPGTGGVTSTARMSFSGKHGHGEWMSVGCVCSAAGH